MFTKIPSHKGLIQKSFMFPFSNIFLLHFPESWNLFDFPESLEFIWYTHLSEVHKKMVAWTILAYRFI